MAKKTLAEYKKTLTGRGKTATVSDFTLTRRRKILTKYDFLLTKSTKTITGCKIYTKVFGLFATVQLTILANFYHKLIC